MNPSGVPLAQHAPPHLSLLSTPPPPRKEPSSPPSSSYLPPSQSNSHNFWQYDQPEDFYKPENHHINETNYASNHDYHEQSITTSDYTTNMAGTTALKSVQPSSRTTQRKDVPKSTALRSVSDPAHKLHPTRSSPAIGGVNTRSVKEIASRLEKKAESNSTNTTPSRPAVPKVVSRLPTAYRNPNASPVERTRAVSDIHSRIATGTRAGQVTRDVGTKSSGVARPSPRNKVLLEHHDITASRNQTQRTSLPRKRVESPPGRNEVSTPKSPLRAKPLLFGEISIPSPSAVGYGIPTGRTRSTSDSAADRTLDSMDSTRQSPETSEDPMSIGQKREHARSQSDTTSRKQIPTRRPIPPQPPSSRSSTSSETPRRLAPSISRLPTSTNKQVATPDSSRSNSPFKTSIKPPTKTTFAIGQTLNNPRQKYGIVNASASQTKSPHTPEELSGSAQRTSRQGVAYKTTSASRNREREVSRTRTSSQTRRAPPTRPATRPPALNLGTMGNCSSSSSTPVEGVDFSARQVEIRERSTRGIQKHQADVEIQRRQSVRQTNRPQRKMVPVNNDGNQNNNTISEAQDIHNTNFPTSQEVNITNDVKNNQMASENVPLRLDTSLAPEANLATIQALETTTIDDDDSPTLGMPGGYISSAQTSPMFEENAPQSAISNVTDIEEELQLELQMPGSFDRNSHAQNASVNNFSIHLHEEENLPLLKDAENGAQTSNTSIEQTPDTIDTTYAPTPQRELDLETDNIANVSQEKMASTIAESELVKSSTNNEFLLQSQVQLLRDVDDDSLYERNSTPSLSNPRISHIDEQGSRPTSHIDEQGSRPTSNIDEHGSGASLSWDDFSMTEATDVDYPEDYVEYKPPSPPPILIPDEIVRSFVYRPMANPTFKAQPSPPLPQSPPRPEVPPKPARYSPMPSPRQVLAPPIEDSPLPSPRSGFGTATLISPHSRTSSSNPHYTPGTGWVAQPPVPVSRPPSTAMDDDVFVDISAPFQPIGKHDSQAQPHTVETEEQKQAKKRAEQEALTAKLTSLRDRRYVIREVVDTEAKHVKDMYVVKEIWKGTADACPKLTEEDKALLFGNIDEIAAFGSEFSTIVKKANAAVLKDVPNDDDLDLLAEHDSQSCIGGIFMQYGTQIEKVNWPFIMRQSECRERIQTLLDDPTVAIWSKECCRAMVDISECWDLQSLLIKPFQRLVKYKDMLKRLRGKTDRDHPDYSNLNLSFEFFEALINRLNAAAPIQAPQRNSADKSSRKSVGKRKEAGLKKLLDLRTLRSAGPMFLIDKTAEEDQRFVKLRDEFSSDFLQLQVILRDVEYYTRQIHEFVAGFLKLTTMMEAIVLSPQPSSSYPELESKWHRFSMKINHRLKQALNDHISTIRTKFITPFEQLIELYNVPNMKMAERAKRRIDWEKSIQKKGNNKPDKNVERYLYLNEQLKTDLPLLSIKTNILAQHCFGSFINLQADWYNTWQKNIQAMMEYKGVPPDIKSIVDNFSMEFNLLDAKAKELTICNGMLLKNAKLKEKEKEVFASSSSKESFSSRSTGQDSSIFTTSSRDSREQTSRPPSSSGKIRPPQLRTRTASTNGSPSLPTPDFGHTNGGFITPSQEHPLLTPQLGYGLGIQDSPSRSRDSNSMTETLVNSQPASINQSSGRPSTSRTSTHRSQAHLGGLDGAYDYAPRTYDNGPRKHSAESPYQTRDSESSYYWRRESDPSERSFDYYDKSRPVSGSTTFSSRVDGPPLNGRPPSGLDGPVPGRPYSGVFHSAMPMSEGPEPYSSRISRTSSISSDRNDDRGRGDGYNVLYLAASLFEFHIADTKREGIYPYLTYEAGELFDVIGEKGELWLAKNQDDPPDKIKVGWIWSKHFARLAD